MRVAWKQAGGPRGIIETSCSDWSPGPQGSLHAVMNAIAHIHIEMPRLTKQCFVAWGAASVAMASRVVLRIRLRFDNHAQQQSSIRLSFHQYAAHQVRYDHSAGREKNEDGRACEMSL